MIVRHILDLVFKKKDAVCCKKTLKIVLMLCYDGTVLKTLLSGLPISYLGFQILCQELKYTHV